MFSSIIVIFTKILNFIYVKYIKMILYDFLN